MADVDHLNPDFRNRLMAMINASGGRLTVNSGYRSVAEQTQLWNAAVAKYGPDAARRFVAPPGHSNHNAGIAADLGGDISWAHAHAAEFGLYFPMPWENWHVEPLGSRSDQNTGSTAPPPSTTPSAPVPTEADYLKAAGQMIDKLAPTAPSSMSQGQAPSVDHPTGDQLTDTQSQDQSTRPEEMGASQPANAPGGGAGDVLEQVRQGFRSVGRDDLAQMVGGPEFGAWVNAESGWDPQSVSPANNQGKPNGGLFQFWAGHDWTTPYFQGGTFTMSPYQQAQLAATKFNLTPERIRQFAGQINNRSYKGWG